MPYTFNLKAHIWKEIKIQEYLRHNFCLIDQDLYCGCEVIKLENYIILVKTSQYSMPKTISIRVPEWMDEKKVVEIINKYREYSGNLDLILALRGTKIDEKSLKEINAMFDAWKESLTHQ